MAVNLRRRVKQVQAAANLIFAGVRGHPEDAQPPDVDEEGSLIVTQYDTEGNPVSPVTPDMDAQEPVGVNVTNVDQEVIPANPDRQALLMTNDSDTVMYVSPEQAAAVNAAPRLNAAGGVYTLSNRGPIFTTGAIHAVHGGAGDKVLTYQEFI